MNLRAEPGTKRTASVMLLIVTLVAFGYSAVLFIGGQALRDAPLAGPILRLKRGLEGLIRFEPPRSQDRLALTAGLNVSPPPTPLALKVTPMPSPTIVPTPSQSPVAVAPRPDDPSLVTFTLEYVNTTGVRLTGVRITNRIPAGTSYVAGSASPAASFDGTTLVWNLGTVDPGEGGTVRFQVLSRTRVTNRAVLTSNEAPPATVESSSSVG